VIMPGRDNRIASTPTVRKLLLSEDIPKDVLRGYVLRQMEKETVSRRGGDIPGIDKSW